MSYFIDSAFCLFLISLFKKDNFVSEIIIALNITKHPITILIFKTSCKIITDKIVPNTDSSDSIIADFVSLTSFWQTVWSKNATVVENTPK